MKAIGLLSLVSFGALVSVNGVDRSIRESDRRAFDVKKQWLEERLLTLRQDLGSPSNDQETTQLLLEAELWRWGRGNYSVDVGRAIQLYWAAAGGTGPAVELALHQLGWFHILPSNLVPALSLSKLTDTAVSYSEDADTWSTPPTSNQRGWLRLVPAWVTTPTSQRASNPPSSTAAGASDVQQASGPGFGGFSSWLPGWEAMKKSTAGAGLLGYRGSTNEIVRDIHAALALWHRSAELGNPESQHLMATHYASHAFLASPGEKILEDKDEEEDEQPGPRIAEDADEVSAIVHSYFAAVGGSILAQMALGYRYLHGYGVVASCEAALPYYELAGNQAVATFRSAAGHYPGQLMVPPAEPLKTRIAELDSSFPLGHKDTDGEVVMYYEAQVIANDASAALQLGNLHLYGGRGVTQDPVRAFSLFEKAVAGGELSGYGMMGALAMAGIGPTPASNKSATEYWRRGAEAGDAASLCGMGLVYAWGVPDAEPPILQNRPKAMEYLEKSIKKGHMEAFYQLGMLHLVIAKDASATQSLDPKLSRKAKKLSEKIKNEKGRKGTDGPHARERASNANTHDQVGDEVSAQQTEVESKETKPTKKQVAKQVGVDLQKALQYLSTAAQHGHLLALHQVGVIYSSGLGVSYSCNTALHAFKQVAERSQEITNILSSALELYKSGDLEGTRLLYAAAAELGPEVAQSNTAWLLEQAAYMSEDRHLKDMPVPPQLESILTGLSSLLPNSLLTQSSKKGSTACGSLDLSSCQQQALRLWRHAAKQRNAAAALKVGDYAFYGKAEFNQKERRPVRYEKEDTDRGSETGSIVDNGSGFASEGVPRAMRVMRALLSYLGLEDWLLTPRGDWAAAARHYHRAAALRHPQALWNLGWMYQWGIGVPFDPHLAKRHFDSTAEAHPDGRWPARLGLVSLRLTNALEWNTQPTTEQSAADKVSTAPPNANAEAQQADADEQSATSAADDTNTWFGVDGASLAKELAALDTALLIVLTMVLLLVLSLRRHHRTLEREMLQAHATRIARLREQEQQAAHRQPAQPPNQT